MIFQSKGTSVLIPFLDFQNEMMLFPGDPEGLRGNMASHL